MNNVTLMGNLGQDPELKTSSNGKSYALFSIATSDGFGDNKKTNWHNCIAFGKVSEIISRYCSKGDSLAVSGSIDYSEKDGNHYTNINVRDFSFGKNSKSESNNSNHSKPDESSDDENDDLPF